MTRSALRLRLMPLSLALILLATAIPTELRAAQQWTGDFRFFDLLQNLLLFVPLGLALARHRALTVMAFAGAVSLAVETTQIWQFDRFPSVFDVVANTLGAVLAATIRRHRGHGPIADIVVRPWMLVWLLAFDVAVVAAWQVPSKSAALANWNAEYPLLLGNEVTRDRPWQGTMHQLVVWNRTLAAREVEALASPARYPVPSNGVVFRDDTPRVFSGGPGVFMPAEVAPKIVEGVNATGTFSVAATVAVADVKQRGPARIVTFSKDTLNRNFDLGQERDRVVFRIRTDVSEENGETFRAETDHVLEAGKRTALAGTYDGAVARVYVDGRPRGRANLAAAGCFIQTACDTSLPLIWAALGACAALLVAFVAPDLTLARRTIACTLAAVAPVCLDQWIGLMPAGIRPAQWVPLSALIGGVAVSLACAPSYSNRGTPDMDVQVPRRQEA